MRHFSSFFKHCGYIQIWLTLDITSSQKHLSMTSQDSRKDSSCRQMSHDLFNAYFLFLKRISLPHFQTHAVGKVLVIFSRKSSLPGQDDTFGTLDVNLVALSTPFFATPPNTKNRAGSRDFITNSQMRFFLWLPHY